MKFDPLPEPYFSPIPSYADSRGSVQELLRGERFAQDNLSRSHRGVLRGLHFQKEPFAQGKLITVLEGRIFDVIIDLASLPGPGPVRRLCRELSAQEPGWFWVPPGWAHGFLSLEENSLVLYKCTSPYRPEAEGGLRWNDPVLGLEWPETPCLISEKDAAWPLLERE